MRNFMRTKWVQICSLIKVCPLFSVEDPVKMAATTNNVSLRDKAIAVAGRVTMNNDGRGCSKVSCPVCLNVLQARLDSDLRMTLAVHLSLWHPDDVKMQWEIMQNKKQSLIHLPSLILGVGMVAGFGALLALSAKKKPQNWPVKRRR